MKRLLALIAWTCCLAACRGVLLRADAAPEAVDSGARDGALDRTPGPDVPDGVDGARDAGLPLGQRCTASSQCATGLCSSQGRCSSVCVATVHCLAGWYCHPAAAPSEPYFCACDPAPESCDGRDNDCDGRIDDPMPRCSSGGQCANGVCECPAPLIACGGACVNSGTDDSNCGACGNRCGYGHHCDAGACVCASGITPCGSECVRLDRDPTHCGTCDTRCRPGATCVNGICYCPSPAPDSCATGCTDLLADPNHCGTCDRQCVAPETCVSGNCRCPGLRPALCGSVCADVLTDPRHCGDCGTDCPSDHVCVAGRCACPALTPDDCDGRCVDLRSDERHCGACATHCAAGATCSGGVCVCPSDSPTVCADTCVDLTRNINHCGACGNGCASACADGVCVTIVDVSSNGWICMVLADGTVRCQSCGSACSLEGRFPAVPGLSGAVEITTGTAFACARLLDGSVQCWGDNSAGQLGDGSTAMFRPTPSSVPGLAGVVQLTAARRHVCARTEVGEIYCWGLNDRGQIGDGTIVNRSTPTRLTLTGATDVDAADDHTCGVAGGGVYCWGDNAWGQIGDGTTTARWTPARVTVPMVPIQVATGTVFSCAVDALGGLSCWGQVLPGMPGVLGSRTVTPTPVPLATPVAEATAGPNLFVRLQDGRVFGWGANVSQLGAGAIAPGAAWPVRVGSLVGIRRITSESNGCALDGLGALWCWGAVPTRISP